MAKSKVVWNKRPQAQDYADPSRYLDLGCALGEKQRILKAYRRAKPAMFAAKDLLRASLLPLLPDDDAHVEADLKRIRKAGRWRKYCCSEVMRPARSL